VLDIPIGQSLRPDLAQFSGHVSRGLDEGPGYRVGGGAGLVVGLD